MILCDAKLNTAFTDQSQSTNEDIHCINAFMQCIFYLCSKQFLGRTFQTQNNKIEPDFVDFVILDYYHYIIMLMPIR